MRILRIAVPLLLLCVSLATPAHSAVRSRVVDYSQDGHELQGYMAWDDAAKGRRPGVLVVHEWWGHNEHARRAADRLAKEGYVAFALDMFGKGKVTEHPDSAQAFVAEATSNVAVAVARFDAALALLKADAALSIESLRRAVRAVGSAAARGRASGHRGRASRHAAERQTGPHDRPHTQ